MIYHFVQPHQKRELNDHVFLARLIAIVMCKDVWQLPTYSNYIVRKNLCYYVEGRIAIIFMLRIELVLTGPLYPVTCQRYVSDDP